MRDVALLNPEAFPHSPGGAAGSRVLCARHSSLDWLAQIPLFHLLWIQHAAQGKSCPFVLVLPGMAQDERVIACCAALVRAALSLGHLPRRGTKSEHKVGCYATLCHAVPCRAMRRYALLCYACCTFPPSITVPGSVHFSHFNRQSSATATQHTRITDNICLCVADSVQGYDPV